MAYEASLMHGKTSFSSWDRSNPASPPHGLHSDTPGGYPSQAIVPVKATGSQSTPSGARGRSAGALSAQRAGQCAVVGAGGLPMEIEQMVTALDQRVTHVHQAEDARIRMLEDQVQRLAEALQAMRVAREIHDERRLKEIRMIESNALLDLGNARQARQDLEFRSEELGSQRLQELREELARHREQQSALQTDYSRELSDEVDRISTLLEEQRNTRVDYGDRIAQSLEGEFQKVQEAIVSEQKLRFEAEGTMLRMVEDVCSRMRGEIQQERGEREVVQSKLLGLLEDTCNRIEGSIHGPVQPMSFGFEHGVLLTNRLPGSGGGVYSKTSNVESNFVMS